MRAFIGLRRIVASNDELCNKIEAMENKYDGQFRIVFDAIRELLKDESKPKKRIGFNVKNAE